MSFIVLKYFKDLNHLKNIELVLENLNLKKTMTIKNDTILIVDDISNVDANVLKNNIKEFLANYNNIRIILSTDIIEEFLAKIECVISAETELLEIKNKSSEKITFIFKNKKYFVEDKITGHELFLTYYPIEFAIKDFLAKHPYMEGKLYQEENGIFHIDLNLLIT